MKRNHLEDGDGVGQGPGRVPATASGVRDNACALVSKAYDELDAYVWSFLAKANLEDPKGTHQQVFLKVLENVLEEGPPGDMRALIRKITLRAIHKEWRDQGRHPSLGGQIDQDALRDVGRNPEELVEGVREARIVRKGIAEVSKESRKDGALLQRVGIDGEDVASVARGRRVSEEAVHSGLGRARERLRTAIERIRGRKGGVE